MGLNSSGVVSLLAGLVILVGTWFLAFYQSGAIPFLQSIAALVGVGVIVGGLVWLGLLLVVTGVLILII